MQTLRYNLIVGLALSTALVACATVPPQATTPLLVTRVSDTPIALEINATSQPNNTFDLTAEQALEVAVFMNFIHAYNHGQLDQALALLSDNVGVSDCDYQTIKVVTFQGKSQVKEWLQQHMTDHDQLEVGRISNENQDPSSGQHVIEVTYSHRRSMTLANLGFKDGIIPMLASKVIFTTEPTLIQSFANGPYGGDLTLCRPGK